MHVVIAHPVPDGESRDETNRSEFFGVQDCIVDDEGIVTIFWPYHSALGELDETKVEGQIVAATGESLLDLQTLIDYIADGTYVKNTIVVPSAEFHRLEPALSEVPDDFRDDLTVIRPGEDVHLDDYDVFNSFH